ncbi:Bromodomain adjacent to zinc finger domain 1A [Abeliophyllum distichum]|uniref:Bromodomain adjacent to zinc finger domain 1A n=1 Tax=Abeliophyllum distichum TaxID=126358 RepID=A0ABD1V2D3_9LAMI
MAYVSGIAAINNLRLTSGSLLRQYNFLATPKSNKLKVKSCAIEEVKRMTREHSDVLEEMNDNLLACNITTGFLHEYPYHYKPTNKIKNSSEHSTSSSHSANGVLVVHIHLGFNGGGQARRPAGGGRPCPPLATADEHPLPLLSEADPILEISSSIGLVDSDTNSSTVPRPFNIQTEHSPSGHLIELDLPKEAGVYNSKSFIKMLKKYKLPPGYLYRVPNPSERIPGSDPREVVVYRDSMTAGLRFPLHPLFVSFFNEFHVTPGQLTPNSWRISIYFLYLCLTNNIEPCLRLFRSVFDMYPVLGSNCYAYIQLKVKLLSPHFPSSNSGWRRRFFFVRPEVGQFPFKTCWRTPFCKHFNEPLDLDHELKTRLDKILSLKPPESQMSEVLSNENLRRVHIGSPEDMDDFDFGGVMDVAGFATDAEDPSLSPLNKKKRRADKGKAIAETTTTPRSVPRTTWSNNAHAFKEFGFPPVDSTTEAEIMLGCVNEKLIESLKNKEAAAMRRIMYTNHRRMLVMEEKVLRDLEKFEKRAADRDHDKKKAVAEVQSLLDKAITESKKKDNDNAYLQKEVDQLRKKLETADDEAIAGYKMSVEYKSNLHMYGAESLKAAIKMTKEWLVDDHSEIDPDEFDRYLRKRRAADLAAQKVKVTNHGGVGSQPAGSLDN